MAKQDYYDLLGVERGADAAAIKSAFRRKAKDLHPDHNPGCEDSEQKFKEIGEAYEVLSDDEKRAAYDRFGHAAFEGANGAGGGGFNGFAQGFSSASFADVFDDLFGEFMGQRRSRAAQGADLRYNLEVTLEEAFHGKSATIEVPATVACETCGGSGARPGSQPTVCGTCGGSGKVRATQGFFTIERPCPACQGQGQIITDPCPDCRGQGRVRKERTIKVDVPPGVEDGVRIRLAGQGEAGARGGPPGDLYIFISVSRHDLFDRDGPNLYCTAPVSMVTAALGGDIEAPTIDGGRVKIKIPEGAQSGKRFRARGKGMSVLNERNPRSRAEPLRGDLFVDLMVETPVKLNARQKELLQEFCAAGGGGDCPQSNDFVKNVKAFWERVTDAPPAGDKGKS